MLLSVTLSVGDVVPKWAGNFEAPAKLVLLSGLRSSGVLTRTGWGASPSATLRLRKFFTGSAILGSPSALPAGWPESTIGRRGLPFGETERLPPFEAPRWLFSAIPAALSMSSASKEGGSSRASEAEPRREGVF